MNFKTGSRGTVLSMIVLFAATIVATAQTVQFQVRTLKGLGGTQTTAFGINDLGWVTGGGSLRGDLSEHALLWQDGNLSDLGTLGGPNSSAGFPLKNDVGFIPGFSQVQAPDAFGEDWVYDCLELLSGVTQCQDITRITLGFVWQNGAMSALPTLGGNNAQAWGANDLGQIVGVAETNVRDRSCSAPQILDYEAVIWTPSQALVQELPPYRGDKISAAIGINATGQVVGASGACAPISSSIATHAVLWEHGKPISIGSLGGKSGNVAYAINLAGQVVGVSDLKGDNTAHAFFWQSSQGMTDLGTLPGDFLSVAYSINDLGQVVGTSCDVNFNCRAFLWQNGSMFDLNGLTSETSLYLVSANDLNNQGEIVGQAFDQESGKLPAFVATPNKYQQDSQLKIQARPLVQLPARLRERLHQAGLRSFGN